MRWLAILIALGATAPQASADEPTARITWADLEPLLRTHPAMVIADQEIAAADGEQLAAHALPNPELGAELGRARSHDGAEEALVWGLEGELALPWPGSVMARIQGASARLRGAKVDRRLVWRELRARGRALFLTVARDQRVAALWRAAEADGAELERAVQLRVDRGEDPPLEALRVRAELERTRMEADRTALELDLHRDALDRWLGDPFPDGFTVVPGAEAGATPNEEEVRRRAREGHPLLSAADAVADEAEAGLREAQAEAVPELVVGAGFESELDARAMTGSVGLEIPILAPGVGEIRAARARTTIAARERELAHREVDLQVDDAWIAFQAADGAAPRYSEGILPAAETAASALTLAYRSGEISLLDVLDARRTWLEVQVEQTEVELERALALDAILTLMGEHDDDH